jgi:hypothetical protein
MNTTLIHHVFSFLNVAFSWRIIDKSAVYRGVSQLRLGATEPLNFHTSGSLGPPI